MKNFANYTIDKNASCLEALQKLDDKKSNQTLFVLDEQKRLIGTVTDGDIRRGLIKGLNLGNPVHQFCFPHFNFINGKLDVSTIHRLKKDGIKVLPKLNNNNQIEKVYDLSCLNSVLPLHAVIMAGGKGERLRPLTDKTPKPMLTLANKPIIEHNIDRLISFGIDTITISVRYLSEQIINYFGDGFNKGIKISYIEEDIPLGTIGCISQIKKSEHDALLVLNSDIFTNINFEDFYLDFEKENADMAVASIPYSVDIPYAIMELNDNNITSFKEKPKQTFYANAGIYLIRDKCLEYIPKNAFFNATDLMEKIIKHQGKLIHSPITGFWIDIGKHDDYVKAQQIAKYL